MVKIIDQPAADRLTVPNGSDSVYTSCSIIPKLYTSPFCVIASLLSLKCSGAIHSQARNDKSCIYYYTIPWYDYRLL